MYIIISSKQYNMNSISPDIDKYFCDLHAAFWGSGSLNVDSYTSIITTFFSDNKDNWGLHDAFFSNYTGIWKKFIDEHNYVEAENLLRRSLNPIENWEKQNYPNRVHKGTPYYFLSVTAILQGDIDKGYTYMHQALIEDSLTHTQGHSLPHTPSLFFVSMQYDKANQFFRKWLFYQFETIKEFITKYCSDNNSNLTADQFTIRFLKNNSDYNLVFKFSYIISKIFTFADIPDYALSNSFCGQIELNILFDLTLIIDNSIKAKNSSMNYYYDEMWFLIQRYKLGITKSHFKSVNRDFKTDFDNAINDLLDNKYKIGTMIITGRLKDIIISYGIRNHAAHNVASSPVIWKRFKEIRSSVFNVLFSVIEILY